MQSPSLRESRSAVREVGVLGFRVPAEAVVVHGRLYEVPLTGTGYGTVQVDDLRVAFRVSQDIADVEVTVQMPRRKHELQLLVLGRQLLGAAG